MITPTGTIRAEASPAPRTRSVTRRRVATVTLVAVAVIAGQWAYGNRHHFFDLRIYYGAIRWWAHGHPLYSYGIPDRIEGWLGFTYPPFAAILMYPMAWLRLFTVILIMWVATAVAVAITTTWLVVPVADRHGWQRWYAVCLAIPLVSTLEPIRETVTFGQINLLLALLVLYDLLFLAPRGSRWTGVAIGIATAIKLTPGVFIVYLLATRRYRATATSIVTMIVTTGLAAAIAPSASARYWSQTVWQTSRIGHFDLVNNQSLMGTLARLALPDKPNKIAWLVLAAPAFGYGMWRATMAGRAGDEVAALALTGIAGCLASPVSWNHHLYWLVPALVVLLDVAADGGRRGRRYRILGVVIWATVSASVISYFDLHVLSRRLVDTPVGFLVLNWYVLVMVALVVLLPIRRLPRDASPALPVAAVFRARTRSEPVRDTTDPPDVAATA